MYYLSSCPCLHPLFHLLSLNLKPLKPEIPTVNGNSQGHSLYHMLGLVFVHVVMYTILNDKFDFKENS